MTPKMAAKKTLLSSTITATTIVAVLLLVTLSKTAAHPLDQDEHEQAKGFLYQKLVAQDALTVSIHEGFHLRHFIASIPTLRSIHETIGQDLDKTKSLIYDCANPLDIQLHEVSIILHRLRHESYHKTPHLLLSDTQALKESTGHAVGLACNKVCDLDHKFVTTLLKRKLQDFSQTVQDALDLVSQLEPKAPIPPKKAVGQAKIDP